MELKKKMMKKVEQINFDYRQIGSKVTIALNNNDITSHVFQ